MSSLRLASDGPIVFVDDDPTELLLARKYVSKSNVRNPMIELSSGEAFLDHMEQVRRGQTPAPALALIDARMDGLDGFAVVERVRACADFAHTPLVVFSNSDEPSDVERAMAKGADDYVVKPSDGSAYLELLNSLAAG